MVDNWPKFEERGVPVVVISPSIPSQNAIFKEELRAPFPFLFDDGSAWAQACGLAYKLPEKLAAIFVAHGVNFSAYNGNTWNNTMPVTATYVVDKRGRIVWAHLKTDFVDRITSEELLDVIDRESTKVA
jgi:peroxiredoxin